ncbi:hypothetical protein SSPS47_33680 [Streptomyces sp. S4.7]|uniref:hypothetical protein n=1 Tax=Streptomyces sp. S4.7 TaxID=2705439 RepID=UPI0013970328|nr:hypothetical protein [Streptomyces sp. S4.7]QHZ00052.1 hypothetical protein SSPS47_33680 [Streptomyces sp. S4.7]
MADPGAGATHLPFSVPAEATWAVPIAPVLIRVLREHVRQFGVAPDGRLLRNAAERYDDGVRQSASG